jgi:2-polyprenyl-3-methyl-5-hydroxy-6-metoxy-1,4-benzoquinol methylase
MSIQDDSELDEFYGKTDPWGYETNPSDKNRKAILIGELEKLPTPKRVLDIGCGHGFITRDLPGENILGVDYSAEGIKQANKLSKKSHVSYKAADLFELSRKSLGEPKGFDMIIITGVLYSQYIGEAHSLVYQIIDDLLVEGGVMVSVHINDWYRARFPYILTRNFTYDYREYQHNLEIYIKK